MAAAVTLRPPWFPPVPPHTTINQHDARQAMLLKVEDLIVFTIY
jgi:hypothetical protein